MVATPALARQTARIDALPHDAAVAEAARVIGAGGLAALPTETVYGLAADARSAPAVAALYRAKGRPSTNPLIVHVVDDSMARAVAAEWPDAAARLARVFWPGPLTLVLPVRPGAVAAGALAGGTTVALRAPAAALMRDVAARVGPLVAPSANRSGRVSATTADAVLGELGGAIDLVVDAGPSPIGVESTVVDCTGAPRLLRPGAVGAEDIEAVLGVPLERGPATEPLERGPATEPLERGPATEPLERGPATEPLEREPATAPSERGAAAGPLRSPGLLGSHYAPRALVRLDVPVEDVRADEGWLALGAAPSPVPATRTVRLSPSGDLAEAAHNLYAGLRALDAAGVESIAVSPIPADGIGLAIRDRLARAAAPRPQEDTP